MNDKASKRDHSGSDAEAPPSRPFNLTRWFLVLSFVSIVVMSTASAALLSAFLSNNMLRRDAVVAQEFVNSIVRAESAEALFRDRESAPEPERFENLFKQIAAIPDVLRANVLPATAPSSGPATPNSSVSSFAPTPSWTRRSSESWASSRASWGK
jgi:hypothetical protein